MTGRRAGRQRGAALIMVLMVVALATVLLAYAATDNELALRRYEIASNQAQMDEMLDAVTALARLRLEDDDSALIDFPGEDWAQPVEGELLNGVTANATIVDLASRFNLNNLYSIEERTSWLIAFRRLLDLLEFEEPEETANRIADWIDYDDRTADGNDNEDADYEADGVRPVNRQLLHPRELLSIPGLDPDELRRLMPYVTAVKIYVPGDSSGGISLAPNGTPLAINFNTCDPFFFALFTERRLSTIELRELVAMREEQPIDGNALLRIRTTFFRDFGLMYGVRGDQVQETFQQLAGFGSRAFAVTAQVQAGDLKAIRTSIVRRSQAGVGKPYTSVIETFPGEGLDG